MVGPRIYKRGDRERWIVAWPEAVGGKLRRRTREFADEAAARARLGELLRLFPLVGAAGLAMDARARDEYWAAKGLLPEGVSLAEAARAWLRAHPQGASLSAGDLAQEWLALRESRDRSGAAGANRRHRLERFLALQGVATVGDLTTERIEAHLWRRSERDGQQIKRSSARCELQAIRSWCAWLMRRKKLLRENPAEGADLGEGEGVAPVALMPEQAAALMGAARRSMGGRMVAWLAIALFAGLRPSEVDRLDGEAMAGEWIRVIKRKRGRGQRLVPVEPCLRAWLQAYPPRWPLRSWRGELGSIRQEAGLAEGWQQDILRHTYISARLAAGASEAEVAAWAGTSPQMVHSYYRALMTREQGRAVFAIWP